MKTASCNQGIGWRAWRSPKAAPSNSQLTESEVLRRRVLDDGTAGRACSRRSEPKRQRKDGVSANRKVGW